MKHLIFDTETTDLVKNTLRPMHKQPRIIEFFGLMLNDELEEESTLNFIFNPGIPITEEITKITGLKDGDVRGAERFVFHARELEAFISSADAVVAHNLSYDMQILDFEFGRLEKKVKWPSRKICTVEATEHMKGFRFNLNALHQELFNEPFTGAHRAEHDVRALTRCYIELKRRGEI